MVHEIWFSQPSFGKSWVGAPSSDPAYHPPDWVPPSPPPEPAVPAERHVAPPSQHTSTPSESTRPAAADADMNMDADADPDADGEFEIEPNADTGHDSELGYQTLGQLYDSSLTEILRNTSAYRRVEAGIETITRTAKPGALHAPVSPHHGPPPRTLEAWPATPERGGLSRRTRRAHAKAGVYADDVLTNDGDGASSAVSGSRSARSISPSGTEDDYAPSPRARRLHPTHPITPPLSLQRGRTPPSYRGPRRPGTAPALRERRGQGRLGTHGEAQGGTAARRAARTCRECGKEFNRASDTRRHAVSVHAREGWVCRGVREDRADELGVHVTPDMPKFEEDGTVWVGGCGIVCSRADALRRHINKQGCPCEHRQTA